MTLVLGENVAQVKGSCDGRLVVGGCRGEFDMERSQI